MLKRGKLTIEEIAEDSGLSVAEVEQQEALIQKVSANSGIFYLPRHTLLVKLDKNKVKTCGRKSIVYSKKLVYN